MPRPAESDHGVIAEIGAAEDAPDDFVDVDHSGDGAARLGDQRHMAPAGELGEPAVEALAVGDRLDPGRVECAAGEIAANEGLGVGFGYRPDRHGIGHMRSFPSGNGPASRPRPV